MKFIYSIIAIAGIGLLVGLLPGVLFTSCSGPEKKRQTDEKVSDTEVTLESLQLTDLEGKPLAIEQLAGKRVFLNFWATWCKPCLAEMPSIDRAANELSDKGVVFIAASDEKQERVRAFKEKNQFKFEIVSTKAELSALGIYALPTTFIFDEKGVLVHIETGAREWDTRESLLLVTETKKL